MSGISIFWVWLSWVVSQGGMHLFQLGFEHETIIPNQRRTCLHTRSPGRKDLGLTFKLYHLVALNFPTSSLILALSLSSQTRSRLTSRLSLFNDKCISFRRIVGMPISTRIIALVSYVRLYGVSWVEDCGVHMYAHSTSNNSSGHLPLATPNLLLSSLRMTLLALPPAHCFVDVRSSSSRA